LKIVGHTRAEGRVSPTPCLTGAHWSKEGGKADVSKPENKDKTEAGLIVLVVRNKKKLSYGGD